MMNNEENGTVKIKFFTSLVKGIYKRNVNPFCGDAKYLTLTLRQKPFKLEKASRVASENIKGDLADLREWLDNKYLLYKGLIDASDFDDFFFYEIESVPERITVNLDEMDIPEAFNYVFRMADSVVICIEILRDMGALSLRQQDERSAAIKNRLFSIINRTINLRKMASSYIRSSKKRKIDTRQRNLFEEKYIQQMLDLRGKGVFK